MDSDRLFHLVLQDELGSKTKLGQSEKRKFQNAAGATSLFVFLSLAFLSVPGFLRVTFLKSMFFLHQEQREVKPESARIICPSVTLSHA